MTIVVDVSCRGSRQTKRFVLQEGEELKVGRANRELDLIFDQRLSRQHFVLRNVERQIEVTHQSTTNPTLIETEGSEGFQEVKRTHLEPNNCRIIAGAHRFVVVIEKTDSVIEASSSEKQSASDWSDIADDSSYDLPSPPKEIASPSAPVEKTIAGDPPVTNSNAAATATFTFDEMLNGDNSFFKQESAASPMPNKPPTASPTQSSSEASSATPSKDVAQTPSTTQTKTNPEQDSQSKPVADSASRKLVFPIADDFFED